MQRCRTKKSKKWSRVQFLPLTAHPAAALRESCSHHWNLWTQSPTPRPSVSSALHQINCWAQYHTAPQRPLLILFHLTQLKPLLYWTHSFDSREQQTHFTCHSAHSGCVRQILLNGFSRFVGRGEKHWLVDLWSLDDAYNKSTKQ